MSQLKVREIAPPSTSEFVEIMNFRFLETLLGNVKYRKDWQTNEVYNLDDVIIQSSLIYRCVEPHTSGETFDVSKWAQVDVNISLSGVTPGSYTKVTVDGYGRVTAGGNLDANDIPTVPFDKLQTVGTPTNLTYLRGDGVWASPSFGAIKEKVVATAAQTVVNITTFEYNPGYNDLEVFLNGVYQDLDEDYIETSPTSITFTQALQSNDKIILVKRFFMPS